MLVGIGYSLGIVLVDHFGRLLGVVFLLWVHGGQHGNNERRNRKGITTKQADGPVVKK